MTSSWKPGTPITSPVGEMITVDLATLPQREAYKLIIGSIVPRPIAFVSTINKKGIGNLAPFSFFNGVSSNPPCLSIAVAAKPEGGKKDTLVNIEETGEFVVNSANQWLIEPLVHCAATFPYGVNEMTEVGLTPLASETVSPMRVKESAIQYECRVYDMLTIGDGSAGSSTLIVGQIVRAHLSPLVYKNGRIDVTSLQPIARLGGQSYTNVPGSFDLAVPELT